MAELKLSKLWHLPREIAIDVTEETSHPEIYF